MVNRSLVWLVCGLSWASAAPGARAGEAGGALAEAAASGGRTDDGALGGPQLNRSAFVSEVLRRNPTIESAKQTWREALARAEQAGVLDDPMVALGVAPLSIGSQTARLGVTVDVSQRLPWFGKLGLERDAASAEARAAQDDLDAARRDIAFAASTLYDDYFVAVRALEINAHHVDLLDDMRRAATAQYEAGRASAQDTLQAEFELTHMQHDALLLSTQRDIAVTRMNELLHRDPRLPLPPPPSVLPLEPDSNRWNQERLEKEAADRNPEVAAARERAVSESARADRARRERLPDFVVSTGYSSMWDMPEHRWMVGIGFNLPVQTGRRAGAIDEADAARARYQSDAERMADAAKADVAVALKKLEEARHVVHLYRERLLPIARDEVAAARAAYVASQGPIVSVLDAEKNLRGAELDEQAAIADWHRRRAELDRALGRIAGLDRTGDEP